MIIKRNPCYLLATLLILMFSLARPASAATEDRFRPDPTAWKWLVAKTEPEITAETDKGFRIVNLEVAGVNPLKLTVVMVKEAGPYNKAWWWWPSLTAAEVGTNLQNTGSRLVQLRPFLSGGQVRYAVVAIANAGADFSNWSWYPNSTLEAIQAAAQQNGDRLIDLAHFVDGNGNDRYASVTVDNKGAKSIPSDVLAHQSRAQIGAWMANHPDRRILRQVRVGSSDYVAILCKDAPTYGWNYYGVTGPEVSHLCGRHFARIIDLMPHVNGNTTYYDVVLLDNGLTSTGSDKPGFEALDNNIRKYLKEYGIPSASVAIAQNGKLVYARGYGLADIENAMPSTPNTVYRIGSASKCITSIAMMNLLEKGVTTSGGKPVTLDTYVYNDILWPYFGVTPGSPKYQANLSFVTIRDVLHHVAGWEEAKDLFPIGEGNPMLNTKGIAASLGISTTPTAKQIAEYMLDKPVKYTPPGSAYSYANFDPCTIATVIEVLSEQTYESYVQQNVIAPAGIGHAGFIQMTPSSDYYNQRAPLEAKYYEYFRAPLVPANLLEMGNAQVAYPYGGVPLKPGISCGGWAASSVGLVRLVTAIDGSRLPRVINQQSFLKLFQGSAKNMTYGLFFITGGPGPNNELSHNGGLPGSMAWVDRYGSGLTFAVMVNGTVGPDAAKDPDPNWHLRDIVMDGIQASGPALTAAANQGYDLFPTYGF